MAVLDAFNVAMSTTTLYLFVTALLLLFAYDFWCHTYFWRKGIRGPTPLPIFGNILAIGSNFHETIKSMSEKYGPVMGLYLWREPVIMVTDVELLRKILIKDFGKFYNRRELPVSSGDFDSAVFSLRDAQWKRVRDILTPTFTGRKMKMMSGIVNSCADTMMDNVQKACAKDGTVQCRELFGGFVMDTVASCAFGLQVKSQTQPDEPFFTHAKKFFQISFTTPVFALVSFLPFMAPVVKFLGFTLFPKETIKFFTEVIDKTIALRKSGHGTHNVDFLQLLIDAQDGKNIHVIENDEDDQHNQLFVGSDEGKNSITPATRGRLTRSEVIGQAVTFLSAGYETTTTALTLGSYLLARNPQAQDKLIAEIDKLAPNRDDVDYTKVSTMPYLDQVMCEILRYYPPATSLDRMCGETVTYKGVTIERGVGVFVSPYVMHHSSDYWPEPSKFDPDRFSKENREKRDPFTWMPFGAGPRICVGMRFALMEAKMALVRVLQKARFETSPLTEIPPKLGTSGLLSPPNGITLKLVAR
ncbi:cytochrome P450 3A29-like [Diadema antillarum]|uniref:cytochrome P450 3A29-like n=1 Tax=Diadema antillarum TaxID=105358 RepID=UPI003A88D71C